MDDWWKKAEYIKHITGWAFDVADKYPDCRIVSLGQSPAWIVRSVGMLRKLRGEEANVGYIPFTGSFVTRDQSSSPSATMFSIKDKVFPTGKCLEKYFNFLGQGNNQPEQVLEAAEKGQRTVLLEMIQSGKGMASFLSIWMSRLPAEQANDLLSTMTFHAFDTSPTTNRDVMEINHQEVDQQQYIPLVRQPLSALESDIMQNTAPINCCDDNSSRLVPLYRLAVNQKTGEGDGLVLCKNRHMTKAISQVLHASIQAREHSLQ